MSTNTEKRCRYCGHAGVDQADCPDCATAENILRNDVLACQSSLVTKLLMHNAEPYQWAGVDIDWDDVENLYCCAYCGAQDTEGPCCADNPDGETEPQEIFEWWLVTDWLADKLSAIGEPVLRSDYGTWWGRTCTGQSIMLDGTLQKIAKSLGKGRVLRED
jgi:hypothetical protein